jgi:prevent-host-death family protein
MHTLPLSELRAEISAMIDLVQAGEVVRILRHGKPVADLVPVRDDQPVKQPSWKRKIVPLEYTRADGKSLAQRMIDDRESARY